MVPRRLLYLWQRLTRGFDDSITWDLRYELARWLLPRLKRFKEIHHGYPSELTEEAWENILKKMILALEFEANEELRHESFFKWLNGPDHMTAHWKKMYQRKQEGLFYLGKFFDHLWD